MAIKVLNNAEPSTITAEFLRMFQEAKDAITAGEERLGNSPWVDHNRPLPQLGVRVQMSKISGQDTSVFSGWNNKQQFRRKMIHFEFVSEDIPHVHEVVTAMKQTGILKKYWGKNAHLSNIVKNDIGQVKLSPKETKNLCQLARDHVNYQASMLNEILEGVTDLDREFDFYKASDPTQVAGRISLRHLLYNYVLLPDGKHSLFIEIHQANPAACVEVVIPNTPDAKSLLDEINKNLPAWMSYNLLEQGVDREFIMNVLGHATDAILCQEINRCTWDPQTKQLTTPRDGDMEKAKAMESAAWYRDEFGDHMKGKDKREAPREFANEEMMYDPDADKSVHTVHEKAGKPSTYKGSAGAPTIQLGRPKDVVQGADNESLSDVSNYSTWSKGELIDLCRKLALGNKSGTMKKGSSPKPSAKESVTTPVRGEAKSSESSSRHSSSSSSSSGEESEEDSSASSVEESQGKSSPAHGE
jgi:hypothetical protein